MALSVHPTTLSAHRTALSVHRTALSVHRTAVSVHRTALSVHRTAVSLHSRLTWRGRGLQAPALQLPRPSQTRRGSDPTAGTPPAALQNRHASSTAGVTYTSLGRFLGLREKAEGDLNSPVVEGLVKGLTASWSPRVEFSSGKRS
eukprot:1001662-Pyramimonas_sp.AAC.1